MPTFHYTIFGYRHTLKRATDSMTIDELARLAAQDYADNYLSWHDCPEEFNFALDRDGTPLGKFKALTQLEPVTSITGRIE